VNKRETLVVNDKTFTIEHTVEHHQSRISAHDLAMQYARAGRITSLYKDEENVVINVFLNRHLVGTIRKAANGLFVWRHFAHRDYNRVIETLVNHSK
jgi:hypothetical protein